MYQIQVVHCQLGRRLIQVLEFLFYLLEVLGSGLFVIQSQTEAKV